MANFITSFINPALIYFGCFRKNWVIVWFKKTYHIIIYHQQVINIYFKGNRGSQFTLYIMKIIIILYMMMIMLLFISILKIY